MKSKLTKFAQVAGIMLALTFTLSCSSDKNDDNSSGGGGGASATGTFKDDRDGKSYKWVKIGEQTWMAENLKAEGGRCYGDDNYAIISDENGNTITLSPAEVQANCDKYGPLYTQDEAKKACPESWHLPTKSEFLVLIKSVEPSCSAPDDCEDAINTKLKATSGWNDYKGKSRNGTNAFGFAALPGGMALGGYYGGIGYYGAWMSSTHNSSSYGGNSVFLELGVTDEDVDNYSPLNVLADIASVRCVKDYDIVSGTFKDDRDSKSYKWVKIGGQTWMAENLNYDADGSKCYAEGVSGVSADSVAKNCAKYGKLYDWPTAMALQASCADSKCASQVSAKHKGICPKDWHIPSEADWTALMESVSPFDSDYNAGEELKATSGWNNDSKGRSGNGYDNYGFSALPGGGLGISTIGSFSLVGGQGFWWSTRESNLSSKAFSWYMFSIENGARTQDYVKGTFFSVRCVQD